MAVSALERRDRILDRQGRRRAGTSIVDMARRVGVGERSFHVRQRGKHDRRGVMDGRNEDAGVLRRPVGYVPDRRVVVARIVGHLCASEPRVQKSSTIAMGRGKSLALVALCEAMLKVGLKQFSVSRPDRRGTLGGME